MKELFNSGLWLMVFLIVFGAIGLLHLQMDWLNIVLYGSALGAGILMAAKR